MFTGIVEICGCAEWIDEEKSYLRVLLPSADLDKNDDETEKHGADDFFANEKIGSSIAVNGACLTIIAFARDENGRTVGAEFFVSHETHSRVKNICNARFRNRVNLERAIQSGKRLGGHIVSGHVHAVGKVAYLVREKDGCVRAGIRVPICDKYENAEFSEALVTKGSVCVDGVSLTITRVLPPITFLNNALSANNDSPHSDSADKGASAAANTTTFLIGFEVVVIPFTLNHTTLKSVFDTQSSDFYNQDKENGRVEEGEDYAVNLMQRRELHEVNVEFDLNSSRGRRSFGNGENEAVEPSNVCTCADACSFFSRKNEPQKSRVEKLVLRQPDNAANNELVNIDLEMMSEAVREGEKGRFTTAPNPWVGCVVLDKNGQFLARGHHVRTGQAHAEREAFDFVKNKTLLCGATVYVTLEPCSHYGRTPPCCNLLICNKVARVVVGVLDPDPRVSGRGVQALREAGIEVCVGGNFSYLVQKSLRPYLHQRRTGRAYCIIKAATTIEGNMAAADGSSKWITGERAREHAHVERAKCQAIIVGSGTVIADNPQLTVRLASFSPLPNALPFQTLSALNGEFQSDARARLTFYTQPVRVILDPHGKTSHFIACNFESPQGEGQSLDVFNKSPENPAEELNYRIFEACTTNKPGTGAAVEHVIDTLVFCNADALPTFTSIQEKYPNVAFCTDVLTRKDGFFDPNEILRVLAEQYGVISAMVEGGPSTQSTFFDVGNEFAMYYGAVALGGPACTFLSRREKRERFQGSKNDNKKHAADGVTKNDAENYSAAQPARFLNTPSKRTMSEAVRLELEETEQLGCDVFCRYIVKRNE